MRINVNNGQKKSPQRARSHDPLRNHTDPPPQRRETLGKHPRGTHRVHPRSETDRHRSRDHDWDRDRQMMKRGQRNDPEKQEREARGREGGSELGFGRRRRRSRC